MLVFSVYSGYWTTAADIDRIKIDALLFQFKNFQLIN